MRAIRILGQGWLSSVLSVFSRGWYDGPQVAAARYVVTGDIAIRVTAIDLATLRLAAAADGATSTVSLADCEARFLAIAGSAIRGTTAAVELEL